MYKVYKLSPGYLLVEIGQLSLAFSFLCNLICCLNYNQVNKFGMDWFVRALLVWSGWRIFGSIFRNHIRSSNQNYVFFADDDDDDLELLILI